MNRLVIGTFGATAVAASLAGCSKPTPEVTIWTGTTSVIASATCWAPDEGAAAAIKDCLANATSGSAQDVPKLPITPGGVVGINVESALEESGWTPAISGQALTPAAPLSQSYFDFTIPDATEAPEEGFLLTVTANGKQEGTGSGIWLFRLTNSGTA